MKNRYTFKYTSDFSFWWKAYQYPIIVNEKKVHSEIRTQIILFITLLLYQWATEADGKTIILN